MWIRIILLCRESGKVSNIIEYYYPGLNSCLFFFRSSLQLFIYRQTLFLLGLLVPVFRPLSLFTPLFSYLFVPFLTVPALLWLSLCLSFYLSICLSFLLFLSLCLLSFLSLIHLIVSILLHLPKTSLCISVCLPTYLLICLSDFLSLCLLSCLSFALLSLYICDAVSLYYPVYMSLCTFLTICISFIINGEKFAPALGSLSSTHWKLYTELGRVSWRSWIRYLVPKRIFSVNE